MNGKNASASAIFAALLAMSQASGAETKSGGFVPIDRLNPEQRSSVEHAFSKLVFDNDVYVMGMDENGPVLMPRKDVHLESLSSASGTGGIDGPAKSDRE